MPERPRVVLALPDAIESSAVASWLSEKGFDPVRRPTAKSAADEMQSRPFDLLIADAAFAFREGLHRLSRLRNPTTPTGVVGDMSAAAQCEATGCSMHVGRPVDGSTLVCYASMAVLDGRPLRRSTRKIVNRIGAVANGAPVHIVDISNEGVRLEVPRDRRSALPPVFTVRVPLIGVGVTVQRMWVAQGASGRGETTWYGGALGANPPKAEQGWRSFVDTLPTANGPTSFSVES